MDLSCQNISHITPILIIDLGGLSTVKKKWPPQITNKRGWWCSVSECVDQILYGDCTCKSGGFLGRMFHLKYMGGDVIKAPLNDLLQFKITVYLVLSR